MLSLLPNGEIEPAALTDERKHRRRPEIGKLAPDSPYLGIRPSRGQTDSTASRTEKIGSSHSFSNVNNPFCWSRAVLSGGKKV